MTDKLKTVNLPKTLFCRGYYYNAFKKCLCKTFCTLSVHRISCFELTSTCNSLNILSSQDQLVSFVVTMKWYLVRE